MTKISEIHGIGISPDEYAGRGRMVSGKAPFLPYLSMTQGEMQLALLQQEAAILAQYYGGKTLNSAKSILENTLYNGVHAQPLYYGAYDANLRTLIKSIERAKRNTRPASRAAFFRPGGVGRGIHIGDVIIDYDARGKQCLQWAESANHKAERDRRKRVCEQTWRIEKILNDGIENCGQYLAYGFLPKNNGLPQNANLKIYNQELAQNDISRVGKFDIALTQQWLNVGMMRRNADTARIKPYGWVDTNAILMTLPEAGQKEIIQLLQKSRPGSDSGNVGAKIAAIVRKYKAPAVGNPALALAIVGAITALIKLIDTFAKNAKNEQIDAFAQVNGFGTRPFGPESGDWDGDGIPDEIDPPPTTTAGSGNTMLLLAGAAALLLLTDEN